jgi:hypothetical protein
MREYTFEVKDKTYTLKYDFNAICEIEEEAELGIPELMSQKRIGMNTARIVIWGGLMRQKGTMTKQQVGELIQDYIEDGNDFTVLMQDSMELLAESISKEDDNAVPKKKK